MTAVQGFLLRDELERIRDRGAHGGIAGCDHRLWVKMVYLIERRVSAYRSERDHGDLHTSSRDLVA